MSYEAHIVTHQTEQWHHTGTGEVAPKVVGTLMKKLYISRLHVHFFGFRKTNSPLKTETIQAMYVSRDIEARSRYHCSCGKAISITYWPVCACLRLRACMWLPRRVDVCMRISACSLANPTCNAYTPYCDVICVPSLSTVLFEIIS